MRLRFCKAQHVQIGITLLTIFTAIGFSTPLLAHSRFTAGKLLEPRNDNDGNKIGPCGNVAPVAAEDRVVLTAGSEVLAEWEETIDHPGWYRLAYSLDGETGFDDHVLLDKIEDTQTASGTVVRSDPSTYHRYSAKVKVPDISCESCSIQLIQVMTEDPENPRNYYSCADVRIVKATEAAAKPATPVILKVTLSEEGK